MDFVIILWFSAIPHFFRNSYQEILSILQGMDINLAVLRNYNKLKGILKI